MDYSCKTCLKKFTQLRNLTRYEKIIHGEKQAFDCVHCSKSFTRRDALKRHQKQHQKVTTHTCDTCKKEFYRRDKLMEYQFHCLKDPLKRKRKEDDSNPASKKMRGENQVGKGELDNDQVEKKR